MTTATFRRNGDLGDALFTRHARDPPMLRIDPVRTEGGMSSLDTRSIQPPPQQQRHDQGDNHPTRGFDVLVQSPLGALAA